MNSPFAIRYEKRYRVTVMRRPNRKAYSYKIGIPPEVLERAAREAGMEIADFVQEYDAVFAYGEEPGGKITFEKREKGAADA